MIFCKLAFFCNMLVPKKLFFGVSPLHIPFGIFMVYAMVSGMSGKKFQMQEKLCPMQEKLYQT